MAYSEDYRRRAVEYHREGHSLEEVREAFKIYPSTLRDWESRYNDGDLTPRYPETRRARKLPLDELREYVDSHADDFQREIGEHFGCSQAAVGKALAKLNYSNKKKRFVTENDPKKRERSIKPK